MQHTEEEGIWGLVDRHSYTCVNCSSERLGWQVQLAGHGERHAVLFAEKGAVHTLTHCGDKLDLMQLIGEA